MEAYQTSHEMRMVQTVDSLLILLAGLVASAAVLKTVVMPAQRAVIMLVASEWIPRAIRYWTPHTYLKTA